MRVPGHLFDFSDVDAARDRALADGERLDYVQRQLALALSQRSRMFALGWRSCAEQAVDLGLAAEDALTILCEEI